MPVPALAAPEGVRVAGTSTAALPNGWAAEATATTVRRAAVLEAAFVQQPGAAGCVRSTGHSDEALAWSTS
ncbi:MAG: hypothetical protein ACRDJN_17210, partial [Chloroflexota bacterium]